MTCACGTWMRRGPVLASGVQTRYCPRCEPYARAPAVELQPTGYTPHYVHFLVAHWRELDTDQRDTLAAEWARLAGTARVCDCERARKDETVAGLGSAAATEAPLPAEASTLDIELAYAALPFGDRRRTRVYLLLWRYTEAQLSEMASTEFEALHHRRMRAELARGGAHVARQGQPIPLGWSVWQALAYTLGWRPQD